MVDAMVSDWLYHLCLHVRIPATETLPFESPFSPDLAGIQVVVLQGERPLAKDNKKLGMFRLDDIPAAPKGRLQWVGAPI